MVKNVFGGGNAKKFAKKNNAGAGSNTALRVSLGELEVYSVVTKLMGGGVFRCVGIDRVERMGRIRGKFRGRGRHSNNVTAGCWVLLGIREWARSDLPASSGGVAGKTKAGRKLEEADLLEVYTDVDVRRLMDSVKGDWAVLINHDPTRANLITKSAAHDDVVFMSAAEMDRLELVASVQAEVKVTMGGASRDLSAATAAATAAAATATAVSIIGAGDGKEIDVDDI